MGRRGRLQRMNTQVLTVDFLKVGEAEAQSDLGSALQLVHAQLHCDGVIVEEVPSKHQRVHRREHRMDPPAWDKGGLPLRKLTPEHLLPRVLR